jgi:signal peptidase I
MTERQERKPRPLWLSTALNVVAAIVVIALVQGFLVKVYSVPSGSMESTLNVGDRILVNRLAYNAGGPKPGDIVVFRADAAWGASAGDEPAGVLEALVRGFGDLTGIGPSNEDFLVKRVVGAGGDTVECCSAEGALVRNGEPLNEDYILEDPAFAPGGPDCGSDPRSLRCFGPVEVPEGSLLVLGDHRGASADGVLACRGRAENDQSGCARFVDEENVVGRVVAKLWPPADWRGF